jgi:hypothetical protein
VIAVLKVVDACAEDTGWMVGAYENVTTTNESESANENEDEKS